VVPSNPAAGVQSSVSLSHPDISIIESTAPVTHEKLSTKAPLGIDDSNQLEACVNILTSLTGVLHADGRILAQLNYLADNFIRTMYVQANRLCIDKDNKVFGITMRQQCTADDLIGSVYAFSKATRAIKKQLTDFDINAFFRMQARVNLELRKPTWTRKDFDKVCFSKWYNQPGTYFRLKEGVLTACTNDEYHQTLASHGSSKLQSVKLLKQSVDRSPQGLQTFFQHVIDSHLQLLNNSESIAMNTFLQHTDSLCTGIDETFPATHQHRILQNMQNQLHTLPKAVAIAFKPSMGAIIVHMHIKAENAQEFLSSNLACTRQLIVSVKEFEDWHTSQTLIHEMNSLDDRL